MMGGFGSGRRSGSGRDTVESCLALDVNELSRRGCLDAGWIGRWSWSRDEKEFASIGLRAERTRLHLLYRVQVGGGAWEEVAEAVDIVRIPCHLGGWRAYFVCPGVVRGVACGRRVVRLYGPGRYFLCRHCCRLAHASQGEGRWDRALRRVAKAHRRLDDAGGRGAPLPPRPKGMWRRTYERLLARIRDSEREADERFVEEACCLMRRIEAVRRGRRGCAR